MEKLIFCKTCARHGFASVPAMKDSDLCGGCDDDHQIGMEEQDHDRYMAGEE